MTPKQRTTLRNMFPHGFLIVAACSDGKQIELDQHIPYNPFTKRRIQNDNIQLIEIMGKELTSYGDWDNGRVDASKLARDSEGAVFDPNNPANEGPTNELPNDDEGGQLVTGPS